MAGAGLLPSLFSIISGAAYRRTIRMIWVKASRFAGETINREANQGRSQDALLIESAERFLLADNGWIEDDKVLRTHRLREAYLAQIGTPKD
jgi:hypothetical protein